MTFILFYQRAFQLIRLKFYLFWKFSLKRKVFLCHTIDISLSCQCLCFVISVHINAPLVNILFVVAYNTQQSNIRGRERGKMNLALVNTHVCSFYLGMKMKKTQNVIRIKFSFYFEKFSSKRSKKMRKSAIFFVSWD